MKVAVAIDSFKGSLSSLQAGAAIKEGIGCVYKDSDVTICPLADGGEGTVEAITAATGGKIVDVMVHNSLGNIISARYGIVSSNQTAIIEMSAAAGITLIDEKDRNPLHTTTYGVGEMILDAIGRGCVTEEAIKCNEYGIDAFFPILRRPCSLQDAMNCENAYKNLRDTAEQVFRFYMAISHIGK